MSDELKEFLTSNKNLFVRNDYAAIVKKLLSSDGYLLTELLEFLINTVHINPLEYMTEIPEGMFKGVEVPTIIVPENVTRINSWGLANNKAKNVIISNPNVELQRGFLSGSAITSITLPEGLKLIPQEAFRNCSNLSRVNLPKSVLRIKPSAFEYTDANLKIVTPYREAVSEKLTIPSSEVDFYKEHLRFTHAPKEEN